MELGSGVPDGWPIYCGISVGPYTYPNMHAWFDGQWVNTYAGATLAAVTCELRYLDAAGNWVTNSDHPMTFDGGIHWHCHSLPVPNPPTSDTRMRLVITAYDSADRSASAIFATLEPPKYIPPKLISCEADRCDESGNIDDEGAYVSAKVKYQLWTPPGVEEQYANTASESVLIVRGADASGSSTIDQVPNVGSDAVCVFGDGLLLPDKEYDVLYKISDQTPYPTVSYAIDHIDQTYNTIDCLAGGKGITFGGFATKEGFVNCMPSYFEGVVEFEKTATLHGPVKATKSDGSQWAWEWDRANGSLLVNSRMSLRNAAGSSDGFVWNAGNYAAYLRTDMHLESGVGFIKAQHTGNSWINGPNAAPIQATTAHADNNGSLWPLASVKSQNGKWCIGTLGNGLEIYYIADGQTDNSPKKRITFQPQAISQIGYASTIQVDGVPIWKFLYPVGAVYFSYSPTSPASLFGGTWAQLTGRFVRMANDVSTGGSDTHKHNSYDSTDAKGSLIGRYEQGGGKYAYYKYVSANAWTTNYHMSGSGTGSVSQSKSTGMEIQGHTAGASSLPPYQDLYAWRRTA